MPGSENMTRTWAEIDLSAIRNNFTLARDYAAARGSEIAAVVKANAYGHGAVKVAKELEDHAGAGYFAVATLDEAIELVKAEIRSKILILSEIHPSLYRELTKYENIIPAVFRYESARALSDAAVAAGRKISFFLVLDTGMARIGLECTTEEKTAESLAELKEICKLSGISAVGVFSHFARADETDKDSAARQAELFADFTARMEAEGINIPIKSLCNSAALTESVPEKKYDLVRQGITLYGLEPSGDTKRILNIKPAMALRSRITDIKTLDPGVGISYGHTFVTDRKMTVATLPCGYADGYPRLLSNKAGVLIDGKYAEVVGRVCMDQMMVDVTDIPSAKVGSVATLMGADKRVRADVLADMMGTISYELVCGISPRVPRIYVNAYGSVNAD